MTMPRTCAPAHIGTKPLIWGLALIALVIGRAVFVGLHSGDDAAVSPPPAPASASSATLVGTQGARLQDAFSQLEAVASVDTRAGVPGVARGVKLHERASNPD